MCRSGGVGKGRLALKSFFSPREEGEAGRGPAVDPTSPVFASHGFPEADQNTPQEDCLKPPCEAFLMVQRSEEEGTLSLSTPLIGQQAKLTFPLQVAGDGYPSGSVPPPPVRVNRAHQQPSTIRARGHKRLESHIQKRPAPKGHPLYSRVSKAQSIPANTEANAPPVKCCGLSCSVQGFHLSAGIQDLPHPMPQSSCTRSGIPAQSSLEQIFPVPDLRPPDKRPQAGGGL